MIHLKPNIIKKFNRLGVLVQLFIITLAFTNCDNNELELTKPNVINESSMEYINSVVNSRLKYLNNITPNEYTKLVSGKKWEHINSSGIESFIVNAEHLNADIEKQYEYFW